MSIINKPDTKLIYLQWQVAQLRKSNCAESYSKFVNAENDLSSYILKNYPTIYQSQLQQSWLKKCSQSLYFNGKTTQPCLLDTAYDSVQITYFNLKKDILIMSHSFDILCHNTEPNEHDSKRKKTHHDSITNVENCITDLLQANRFFNEKLMMLNIQCQFLKKKSQENEDKNKHKNKHVDKDKDVDNDLLAKLTAMPEVGISPGDGWSPGWPVTVMSRIQHNKNEN
jgi:hypothetical protein